MSRIWTVWGLLFHCVDYMIGLDQWIFVKLKPHSHQTKTEDLTMSASKSAPKRQLKLPKTKHVLTLIESILDKREGRFYEIALGIMAFCRERRTPESGIEFTITWDQTLWTMGKKNPAFCIHQCTFQCLYSDDSRADLVGFVKNCFTSSSKDATFHKFPKPMNVSVRLVSVE